MGVLPSWTALPGASAAAAAVPTRIAGAPTMGVLPSWTALPGAHPGALATVAGAPAWTALPGAMPPQPASLEPQLGSPFLVPLASPPASLPPQPRVSQNDIASRKRERAKPQRGGATQAEPLIHMECHDSHADVCGQT